MPPPPLPGVCPSEEYLSGVHRPGCHHQTGQVTHTWTVLLTNFPTSVCATYKFLLSARYHLIASFPISWYLLSYFLICCIHNHLSSPYFKFTCVLLSHTLKLYFQNLEFHIFLYFLLPCSYFSISQFSILFLLQIWFF